MGLSLFVCVQATWQSMGRWIKAHELALVDLVEFGPSDRNQTQVINSELLITLVKSNGCDLISQSVNDSAECGCLWMIR